MEVRAGDVVVNAVEHGRDRPVLVLHGAGVDHRETEACFEPVFDGVAGFRRIYPDLPGHGRTPAPEELVIAEDVLATLTAFADQVAGDEPLLVVGHSAGAHYARAMAARRPDRVAGLALVCPLLPDLGDVPEHRPVAGPGDLGDEEFRGYFVVQTPQMLDRYERHVLPAIALADHAAAERIGARWTLAETPGQPFAGPVLVVAGRLDSVVGWTAAADLAATHPRATLAVVDDAGHALPHESPDLLRVLVHEWLARVDRGDRR